MLKLQKIEFQNPIYKKLLIGFWIFFLTISCSKSDAIIEIPAVKNVYEFDNLDGWQDASQNMGGVVNYNLENGKIKFFTNPNTTDRPKIKTTKKFKNGTFTWRVFASPMGIGDRTSIGAFLYHDDQHELDFEMGYGTQIIRSQLNAQPDDLVIYMTSQDFPFVSNAIKIKRNNWYNLSINLVLETNGKYTAIWKIDNNIVQTQALNYGSEIDFSIFCSLENLNFIGDSTPTTINTTYFDFVDFKN